MGTDQGLRKASLIDMHDLSYKHLATMRSFDQIESRTATVIRQEVQIPIPAGLESIATSRKLEILKKNTNEPNVHRLVNQTVMDFEVVNEEKNKIYRVLILKKWAGVTCELMNSDGVTPVLSIVLHNQGFACRKKLAMVISVTHHKNNFLGSVIVQGETAVVLNSNGHKILRILTRTLESGRVDHVVVEVDNTRLANFSNNIIRFYTPIDAKQRALLFGAWVPAGLKHFFNLKEPL